WRPARLRSSKGPLRPPTIKSRDIAELGPARSLTRPRPHARDRGRRLRAHAQWARPGRVSQRVNSVTAPNCPTRQCGKRTVLHKRRDSGDIEAVCGFSGGAFGRGFGTGDRSAKSETDLNRPGHWRLPEWERSLATPPINAAISSTRWSL